MINKIRNWFKEKQIKQEEYYVDALEEMENNKEKI